MATLESNRSLAISAPRAAAVDDLISVLRSNGRRTLVAHSDNPSEVEHIRAAARRSPIAVIAEGVHADDVLAAALLASGCTVVRIPMLSERREDLARLLGEARAHAQEELAVRAHIRADMKALYRYSWPGHLDEVVRVMRMLVAVRGLSSLRKAASLLGVPKSTLANQLATVGVQLTSNATRA
jgi:DNA-binding NtrC family response regulator